MHLKNLPEDAALFDTIETEQLEYDSAKLFATVYRRFKYKRDKANGSTEFFIALHPQEKDKSIAAPSLKTHVATEKYMWHTPIQHQMQSSLRLASSCRKTPSETGSTGPAEA
jgi:transposase